MTSLQAAHADGVCLRYPDSLGIYPQVTQENAAAMLIRAISLAQSTPFGWGYIDKPPDGSLFLVFQTPQLQCPPDGIVYQDREQKYYLPCGNNKELEVCEVKLGFVPGVDQFAYRVRRRFRMYKGGHPQLMLIHYSRGQSTTIVPSLNSPARNYPLRPVNEPAIFVLGERQGQKVYPNGVAPPLAASADRGIVQFNMPPNVGAGAGMGGMGGMGAGPLPGNPAAMLAHQNSNMEVLERRAQRERGMSMFLAFRSRLRRSWRWAADEAENISTRTLALTRYRRNHEYMNEVFMHARLTIPVFAGDKKASASPPYSIFKLSDLEENWCAKTAAEVEELKNKAAARKQAADAARDQLRDVPMGGLAISDPVP
ncbi:uncharacterized protein BXZ73DRAFT_46662 [Epithele typhae]|uniref:uncharacterized protein n=1 Tax=Epithele typhae TaxID=378194 RepID=UPI0020077B93|nr:uncharacterized protein BXZ73DRAFT_46662 [Epithele typhae]KAH9932751.1 hypothetical protein BXZ73DRAFT_46662 [Epithele typhae]